MLYLYIIIQIELLYIMGILKENLKLVFKKGKSSKRELDNLLKLKCRADMKIAFIKGK